PDAGHRATRGIRAARVAGRVAPLDRAPATGGNDSHLHVWRRGGNDVDVLGDAGDSFGLPRRATVRYRRRCRLSRVDVDARRGGRRRPHSGNGSRPQGGRFGGHVRSGGIIITTDRKPSRNEMASIAGGSAGRVVPRAPRDRGANRDEHSTSESYGSGV